MKKNIPYLEPSRARNLKRTIRLNESEFTLTEETKSSSGLDLREIFLIGCDCVLKKKKEVSLRQPIPNEIKKLQIDLRNLALKIDGLIKELHIIYEIISSSEKNLLPQEVIYDTNNEAFTLLKSISITMEKLRREY